MPTVFLELKSENFQSDDVALSMTLSSKQIIAFYKIFHADDDPAAKSELYVKFYNHPKWP